MADGFVTLTLTSEFPLLGVYEILTGSPPSKINSVDELDVALNVDFVEALICPSPLLIVLSRPSVIVTVVVFE